MKGDRLFEIFKRMLHAEHDGEDTATDLIRQAATAYALELQQQGQTPYALTADLIADLEAEVTEMYRKVTYGFFSLHDYRKSRRS